MLIAHSSDSYSSAECAFTFYLYKYKIPFWKSVWLVEFFDFSFVCLVCGLCVFYKLVEILLQMCCVFVLKFTIQKLNICELYWAYGYVWGLGHFPNQGIIRHKSVYTKTPFFISLECKRFTAFLFHLHNKLWYVMHELPISYVQMTRLCIFHRTEV